MVIDAAANHARHSRNSVQALCMLPLFASDQSRPYPFVPTAPEQKGLSVCLFFFHASTLQGQGRTQSQSVLHLIRSYDPGAKDSSYTVMSRQTAPQNAAIPKLQSCTGIAALGWNMHAATRCGMRHELVSKPTLITARGAQLMDPWSADSGVPADKRQHTECGYPGAAHSELLSAAQALRYTKVAEERAAQA